MSLIYQASLQGQGPNEHLIVGTVLHVCEVVLLDVQHNVLLQHLAFRFPKLLFFRFQNNYAHFQVFFVKSWTFSMAFPSFVVEYLNISSFTTCAVKQRW